MLLRQMSYFCSVCETGSFTKAAEECYVSQSAISQQVKALETELGVQLLERHGRSFSLTPAGEHFYHRAQAAVDDIERIKYETVNVATGAPSSLSVGYLSRYDGWEVREAIAAFAVRHPKARVTTASGSHDDLYRLLLSGEVDAVFNDKRRAFADDYVNHYLMTCFAYVDVSEASRLAWADELTVSDLAGETCILISSPDLEETERAYYTDVLNFDCPFVFARSMDEARMMVASNRGFMPVERRANVGRSGSVIRRIPLVGQEGHVSSDYYLFWAKDRDNEFIEEFAGILDGIFAEPMVHEQS